MRSPAPVLALLLALPIAIAADSSADAQMVTLNAPLCCDSGSGKCGPPQPVTSFPTSDPLGVQTQCPLPKEGTKSVVIEIPGAGSQAGAVLEVQTAEPVVRGFEGACLAPSASYTPMLPTVCYRVRVTGATQTTTQHAYSVVTALAANVFQPYTVTDTSLATANNDSYLVLMTCQELVQTPHGPDCPTPTRRISHSCCDLGGHMTALHAPGVLPKYARGFASMPTFP